MEEKVLETAAPVEAATEATAAPSKENAPRGDTNGKCDGLGR